MKILVFSDVHGKKDRLLTVLKKHNDAEYKISLGDSELRRGFLQKHDIIAIKGNYPLDAGLAYEHIMDIGGLKWLLVHGHKNRVKQGYETLYHKILETESDLALHGHTHQLHIEEISNKYFINPGAINNARGNYDESYLIIHHNPPILELEWHSVYTHDIIRHETIQIKPR